MAVSVLGGRNTHGIARIWGYECEDIKRDHRNQRIKLALIYDIRFQNWSEVSKQILESRADVALASDSLGKLQDVLADM